MTFVKIGVLAPKIPPTDAVHCFAVRFYERLQIFIARIIQSHLGRSERNKWPARERCVWKHLAAKKTHLRFCILEYKRSHRRFKSARRFTNLSDVHIIRRLIFFYSDDFDTETGKNARILCRVLQARICIFVECV